MEGRHALKQYCTIMYGLSDMRVDGVIADLGDEFIYLQNLFLLAPEDMWQLSNMINLLPCFLDGKIRSLKLL